MAAIRPDPQVVEGATGATVRKIDAHINVSFIASIEVMSFLLCDSYSNMKDYPHSNY